MRLRLAVVFEEPLMYCRLAFTYIWRLITASFRSLLVLCIHSICKQFLDVITIIPDIKLAERLPSISLLGGSDLSLESVGEVAFGRDMRKKMRNVRKCWPLGAQQAVQRNDWGFGFRWCPWCRGLLSGRHVLCNEKTVSRCCGRG